MDSFTLDKIEFAEVKRILSEFCSTSLGKELALRIGPSRNPEVINRWLDQTSQMVKALRDRGVPPMGGITDVRDTLHHVEPGGGVTAEQFAALVSALKGMANLRGYLLHLDESLTELRELGERLGAFDGEIKAIEDVVGPDGTVLDTASPKLTEIRREMEATTQRIHEVIHGYVQNPEVARLLQNATVRLHGDRYVLPVKAENRGRLRGVVHRASNTGATVFVEPTASVELNNRLSDLAEDERREIRRLLNELMVRVHPRAEQMLQSLRAAAQTDLVSAKAQYAYQFEMTCPAVLERGHLQFHEARHPLLIDQAWRQEKQGVPAEDRHPVVPIDVRLGQDFDVLVVTGSNTGGKTVALKTVALLVAMSQSGMHVPARRGSVLPVFRDVFIDIGDEQSLQQSLSTFGAHMKRIRYVLRKADRSSLVLLDELGAGTDPDEGGAIGQAILDELRSIGCLGMVTTHLSVLKAYAFNHDRVDNASVEFDTKTLRPTYHLQIGTPGESHAITVAARLGLPRSITSAAKRHLSQQGKQFRKAIQATTVARESAEEARAKAQLAELAAVNQAETYESKLADLHRLKAEFESWLAQLPELQPGDEVPVPTLGKTGKLVRMELHRQVALVDCDGKQVEVPIRELMPDLGQDAVRKEIASLRRRILAQAEQAEQTKVEAQRLHEEYQRSLQMQKERARQFDAWLGAISRLKVGDEVPIARRPGKGKVVRVDLPGMRATVRTHDGQEQTLSLQDLFPQTGPFARRSPRKGRGKSPQQRRRGGREDRPAKGRKRRQDKDLPIRRRSPESRAAQANRKALEKVEPGDSVFVIPFNKTATLIRIDLEKEHAVVQSGVFEMDLPLSDIEPARARA